MKSSRFLLALLLLCAAPVLAQETPTPAAPPTPAPTPTPTPDPLALKTPAGMVYVPGGRFTMGTDEGDREGDNVPRSNEDARPRHIETVAPFYLDKLEVTNAQYKAFCDATNYPVPPIWKGGTYPPGHGNYPVTHVSWWEARAYAAWQGKRLPTEVEWEKAARGTDGREFPWGSDWDSNRAIANREDPEPVGTKPEGASSYGALDLAGNVFEWTDSWYEAYVNAPKQFPEYGQKYKVIRGGAFTGSEGLMRTYFRSVGRLGTRHEMIGFRCAQSAQ